MSDFELNVDNDNDEDDDAFARDFYVDPSTSVLNSNDLPLPDVAAQAQFHSQFQSQLISMNSAGSGAVGSLAGSGELSLAAQLR